MPLTQEIAPLNPELMDTLVAANEGDWIPTDEEGTSFIKVLWTGAETGRWAVLLRWSKGHTAAAHKHLAAGHTYVLSGKLEVRGGVVEAGTYIYERNGMIHEASTALEDTELLFIGDGPVLFYDEDSFTGYLGWEELERMQAEYRRTKAA